MKADSAVEFPVSDPATGARSSAAFAQAVIADALSPDSWEPPPGEWRKTYPAVFRRLVEDGLQSTEAAASLAKRGLGSVHSRLGISLEGGPAPLESTTVVGSKRPSRRVRLPYGKGVLIDSDIDRRLDDWLAHGIVEPSCAEAVRTVIAHPEWLDLSDLTFVILGAGAQMGPVTSLLSWGAEVIAVDLPRPAIWDRLRSLAEGSAGRLHAVQTDVAAAPGDLAAYLATCDLRGRSMVLGNYAYAHGADHVRVAAAVDAVTQEILHRRDGVRLAFLGTPTDVYAVPAEVVEAAQRAYDSPGPLRLLRPALRAASRGRLCERHYDLPAGPPDGDGPEAPAGITDSLVLQQGPNYAMAKRIQRWRATAAAADGVAVSFAVAPPSRTASVVSNRLLRAAYDGAHRFGVEIFDPSTSNALMATLLIHDLRNPDLRNAAVHNASAQAHPWRAEAAGAAHGGLWRQGYVPRTVLGMAVGVGARSLIRRG